MTDTKALTERNCDNCYGDFMADASDEGLLTAKCPFCGSGEFGWADNAGDEEGVCR